MAAIEAKNATVYFAPTARKRYFSARSAAVAEARAKLRHKYPSERAEYEDGRMIYPGWTWEEDEHLTKVHARLCGMILRQFHQQKEAAHA
ncbi:TPA: hypothetical protein NH745_005612 [Pseudomonas aeruginosa]|uniref:hypothetical protein n=1 Tax=Pseudomonas aeruginosa TaxID=287 RepID=UPI0003B9D84A|nr:hypothetical protein [Pseudomonas aeruginosa]EKX7257133.1 hypothetical protein [Pseudomonas aeruginosa]ERV86714.1 hypothetical protein Q041_02471 [Pseudomonas aeruginosa BWHPSA028]KSF27726.2 hypothetical protein AO933_34415 [Pseudomonas aeruginosa]KSN54009.2 hypothetical protein APA86_33655 [Pseudomonas aeruginosa]MBG3896559.1 hypothetical protein [Pseudomonas aeruginosa]